MDIEKLSKSQIILLTLLVSFVTSIATGIVTVSLMDQAPPAIAQTVNRVIERTVEKIVPSSQAASTVVTQEKTVIVKEADLVAQAVKKVSPSVVRLYSRDVENPMFLGLGIVLDSSGTIVSDTSALGDGGDANIQLPDGTRVRAFVKSRDTDNGFAFLQAATSTDAGPLSWAPATLATGHPVLGESIIALYGKTIVRIADGIVTSLMPKTGGGSDTVIETSIAESAVVMGGALINIDGNVIGVSTGASRAVSGTGFVPASALLPQETQKK